MEDNRPKLRLAPPEPDIGETDGFEKNDLFGYAEFGGRLANIVRNLQTPLVLALTGGWGSGKSVFAKQWAGELRKQWANPQDNPENGKSRAPEDAPVIYFDAFANDHQNNALFALAGEVMEFIGRRKGATEKMKDSAKRIAEGVGGVLMEGIARCATGGLAGAENIAATMQSALKKRMAEAEQGRDAIKEFRNALESAAQELGGGHPLVFIVDELDRCRPDFALELLEKIKHLFSVPNVCFLVVTNLEQFGAVVQRAYGYNQAAARTYLDKFFQHTFRLPVSEQHGHLYICHLWAVMNFPGKGGILMNHFAEISDSLDLSLRDMEQALTSMVLLQANKESPVDDSNSTLFGIIAALCALRKSHPDVYRDISRAAIAWEQLPQPIRSGPMAPVLALTKEQMSEAESAPFVPLVAFPSWKNADDRRNFLAKCANRLEGLIR